MVYLPTLTKETVDLSWQGIRGEGFVKACTCVAVVIYGKEMDGNIKTMLKSTSAAPRVCLKMHSSFRWLTWSKSAV